MLEYMGSSPGCTSNSGLLLWQALATVAAWEPWMEFLTLGFTLVQSQHLQSLGSELVEGMCSLVNNKERSSSPPYCALLGALKAAGSRKGSPAPSATCG